MNSLVIGATALLLPLATASSQVAHVSYRLAHFEIPVGRDVQGDWQWHRVETPTNRAEYVWTVQVQTDSNAYTLGFILFKHPGAQPTRGNLAALLRAGQPSYWVGRGPGGRLVRVVRPRIFGDERLIVIELEDSARIAQVFAGRPPYAEFAVTMPSGNINSYRVPVTYDGMELAQRSRILDSLRAGRKRWRRAAISEYLVQSSFRCFCIGDSSVTPPLLTVRDGRVVARTARPAGNKVTKPTFWTIDSVFAVIEEDLKQGIDLTASIELDSAFGFPRFYRSRSYAIPDGWLVVSVDTFAVVRRRASSPIRRR